MVKHNEKDELGPETVYRLWLGSKFERRWSQFFEKNEKSEKSYFLNFSSIFEINRCKNWLFSNNFWVQVTRRAGCLILDSKSNTVSGQIVPESACNIFVTFESKYWFLTLLRPFKFRFYFIFGGSFLLRWIWWGSRVCL